MMLKDIKLDLSNIVANPQEETVQAVSARNDTDKSSVIIGYRLEILTRRGSRNPVKLPLNEDNKKKIERVAELLKKHDTVEVILSDTTIRPYALISNGNLISGVSIKADSFTIVEPDAETDLLA